MRKIKGLNGQAAVDAAISAGFVLGQKVQLIGATEYSQIGTVTSLTPFTTNDPINNPPFIIEVTWPNTKQYYRQWELQIMTEK